MRNKYKYLFIFLFFIICFFIKPSNSFCINKISLARANITLSTMNYKYDGTAKKPTVKVRLGSRILVQGVDYYLYYSNCVNAGTATVTIYACSNSKYCSGFTYKKYTISRKSLNDSDVYISLPKYFYTYTGKTICPSATIRINSKKLNLSSDYKLVYKNNTNVGTATIWIYGNNNYCGNINVNFKISTKPITSSMISIDDSNCKYNSKSQIPKITIVYNYMNLIENKDYKILYKNNISHSINGAKVIISGIGNYSGVITKTFSIKPSSQEVVDYAKKYIGTSYSYGGNTTSGFDCSGFTQYVFKYFDYSLPHSASKQLQYGKSITFNNLQPGDLVFFRTSDYHVGIYIGDGKFIHSPSSGRTVCITKFYDDSQDGSYYGNRYLGARRIFE